MVVEFYYGVPFSLPSFGMFSRKEMRGFSEFFGFSGGLDFQG